MKEGFNKITKKQPYPTSSKSARMTTKFFNLFGVRKNDYQFFYSFKVSNLKTKLQLFSVRF